MKPRVALLIETSGGYGRELLKGIAHHSRLNGPWSFYLVPSGHEQSLPDTRLWRATGIIARVETLAMARRIAAAGLPIVGLDLTPEVLTVLRQQLWVSEIHPDSEGVARLAGEHLLERGFRNFGFVGLRGWNFSSDRQEAFVRFIATLGLACPVFNLRKTKRTTQYGPDQEALAAWLRGQPRPLGLMCCNDDCAREVLDAALVAGVRVPDEMAVIGVDNDDLLCSLSNPPLSSVIPNAFQAGYQAAELLHRAMLGKRPAQRTLALPPLGVQTRQSTDVVAVEDARVSAAVRFIRENACRNICVKDVLRAIPMSRTALDARFKQQLGCTPHAQILRVRIEQVKTLLTTTDLPLAEIAQRTGFDHVEYLSVAFRRATQMPPGQYRLRRTGVRLAATARLHPNRSGSTG